MLKSCCRNQGHIGIFCILILIQIGCDHGIKIKAGTCSLPFPPKLFSNRKTHLHVIKHRHFRRFGKKRQPQLLYIPVSRIGSIGIDPAASVSSGNNVLKISDNEITLVLLKMLIRHHTVAGFGSCVDPIKNLRPPFQVKAQSLKMFVPVGVFDDNLDLWICGLGRSDNECSGRFFQQVHSELRPAPISFGTNAVLTLAVCEVEIIQYQFVKMPGCHFNDLFQFFAVFFIRITIGLKIVSLIHRNRYSTGCLDSPILKKLDNRFQCIFLDHHHIPVGFKVDLLDFEVLIHLLKSPFEPFRIFHFYDLRDASIYRGLEILISIIGKCR